MCVGDFAHLNLVIADFDSFLAFSKVTGIETIHMFGENRSNSDQNNTMNSPMPPIENASSMKNVIGMAFDYDRKRCVAHFWVKNDGAACFVANSLGQKCSFQRG